MNIPFLERVSTIDVYLKGGAVMRKEFLDFSWKYTGDDGITNLSWTPADGQPWFVNINEIAGIEVVRRRLRLRLRG